MKEKELREIAECRLCKKPFGASGIPIFYRVKVETYVADLSAIARQAGFTQSLGGSAALALVMGPDENMAELVDTEHVTVCGACAINQTSISELMDA